MAKGFNFSLQKVLEVRQHQENKQAVKLNKSKRVLKTEEQKLDILKDNKKHTLKKQKDDSEKDFKVDLNKLKITQDYIVQLNNHIEDQNEKVQHSDEAVKEDLEKLNEAVKEKKVVEKLKEKHFEEHKKTKNQEINKQQDEIAIRVVKKL